MHHNYSRFFQTIKYLVFLRATRTFNHRSNLFQMVWKVFKSFKKLTPSFHLLAVRGGALFEQTYDGTVENVAAYRPLRICGDQLSMFVSRANYDGLFSNATLPQKSCAQLNEDNERFVTYLGQPVYTLSCNQDQTLSGKRRIPGGNCTAPTFKPYS
eukprot:GHVT01037339.1.p1 GENE.GHVT01037339.1~~GHVT01037339.1.p1  ORF type:complete len:156 (-),score=4.18 GHVT01037339.1:262-729(-)